MKNNIFKILLLIISFQQTSSMEDSNNPYNKVNPYKSSAQSASQLSDKEALSLSQHDNFDISAQNLSLLLINKDKLSNLHDKEIYLANIQKLLSIFYLMEKTISYLKSINKLNATLAALPKNISLYCSFQPINVIKSEMENDKTIFEADQDNMQAGKYYIAGVSSSEAKAVVIQSQEIWRRYKKYFEKKDTSIQKPVEFYSRNFETHINTVLDQRAPIILRKKIKDITRKLITSKDTELKTIGQWLLLKIELQKMLEITDSINIELFKIIAGISPQTLKGEVVNQDSNSNSTIVCFDFNEALKELKINQSFKNWLPKLNLFIGDYIKDFFESLSILEKAIQFIRYIYAQKRLVNYKESSYLVNLTNNILNEFELNKKNYVKLYQILLQEQKRIFKSVSKKIECSLRQAYAYNLFTEDQATFSATLFEPKNKAEITSDNYLEDAKKFEKKQKAYKLNQQKRKAQQAKRKLKKISQNKQSSKSNEEVEKDYILENLIGITDNNITPDNLLTSFNGEIPVNLSHYDNRCLCWFNKEYREYKTTNDLLYHSFPLGMDYLIKKYGRRQNWPNRTHHDQIDTRYYIGGEIHYANGNKQIVLFAITQDPSGIIYHRGFELKEENLFDEFASNKFEFDFPKGFEEPKFEVKSVICNLNNCDKLTYEINPFCITLKDTLNNVTIVLFRSSFELEAEN